MIVQFTVENFLSFKSKATLDLTAINSYKEHTYNLIDYGAKEKINKVAAIYGANASGKSNLIIAMRRMRDIVKQSFNNVDKDGKNILSKYFQPFLFDEEKKNTEFEIILILDNAEYKYGFEYNDESIVTEWLYKKNLKTNRMIILFERAENEVTFGASIKKECELYKEQIPKDALILSFFNKLKLKTEEFKNVYNGIMYLCVSGSNLYENDELIEDVLPSAIEENKPQLMKFLSAIDTGIQDIEVEKLENRIQFYTTHVNSKGTKYKMNMYNESEGTLKCIGIYIVARATIFVEGVLVVDELNAKLHPLLLKFIIDLFYDNASKAQLIYTTHDTTLMDKKFFRRDQIWFVQKDEQGCSDLCALSDFKVRSDASFEKDYLAGVYGGIPFLKEFEMLVDENGK